MLLNTQGINPDVNSVQYYKLDYLSNYVSSSNNFYPFIALTETWLKPFNTDAQIHINGYNVFRADRIIRERGGALLYAHESIPITSSNVFDNDVCEAVLLKSSPIKLIVASVYKPCNASDSSFADLLFFLQDCINQTEESDRYTKIILGDLNFPDLWKTNNDAVTPKSCSGSEQKLTNFMNNNSLCQCIDTPTRQGNLLDLFLCNSDCLVQHVSSVKHVISDHNIVDVLIPSSEIFPPTLKASCQNVRFQEGFNSLNLFKADFVKITKHLEDMDWEHIWSNCSLEEFPQIFHNAVLGICQKFAPLKTVQGNKQHTAHQRSYHTIQRKKRKLNSRLKCLKELNPSSRQIPKLQTQINQLLNELKELSKSKQSRDEQKAIEKIKSNPRYFYSYAKKLSKTKKKISQLFKGKEVITESKQIADALQEQFCSTFSDSTNPNKQIPAACHPSSSLPTFRFDAADIISAIDEINANSSCPGFSIPAVVLKKCKYALSKPLLMLWQESFNSGVVPSFYKQQLVTPVFKKGSRSLPQNYRPVSLTAHEIKIFERIVRTKMVDYLETNCILKCNQHGFRKGKSCLTQLLKQYEDILINLLNDKETDVIYVDFAKAFDKVDHEILIQKLKNIGIEGKLLKWLIDFLKDRHQVVVVDGILSYLAAVLSGVPQGTVLGPLLFLIYLNDLSDFIVSCDFSCFADDTRLQKAIAVSHDALLLQDDLLHISDWSTINNMKLHDDKFVYLNFNTRHKNSLLQNLPFYKEDMFYTTKDGHILETSDSVKDLGITFTEDLNWSTHISTIVKKAKQKAGWALSIFKDRSPFVMKTLYKSIVRSHLEYCCPLWIGISLQSMQDLESIQRSFTSKISCPPSVENYWDRLQYLQLMSLQRRRERYVILHMWKILNDITSNDLNITFHENRRFGIMAYVPPLNTSSSLKSKTLHDSSFSVMGPRLWNVVPKDIKSHQSLITFKCHLDIFLTETFPDRPPVSGYTTQNNNSILEWNIAGSS